MTSPIADGILAATHKLVQQAMTGQWQDMPKTIEERRVLLDRLNASASPRDQQWLSALRQAMAESDAAVAKISAADATSPGAPSPGAPSQVAPSLTLPRATGEGTDATGKAADASAADSMLDMIRGKG